MPNPLIQNTGDFYLATDSMSFILFPFNFNTSIYMASNKIILIANEPAE